jgi:hypothetical protein
MSRWDLTVTLRHPMTARPEAERRADEYLVEQVTAMVTGGGVPLVPCVVRDPGTFTITFADWAVGSPAWAASVITAGYRDELVSLIARSPGLYGWKVEVTATPATPSPVPGWPTAAITSPVPGEDLDDDTAAVLGAADLFRAFPLPTLTHGHWADPDPARAATTQHQARALAGCLIVAAEMVTNELFDDLEAISAGIEAAGTHQLGELPPQWAAGYTPLFTRGFLVAFVDLSARLTRVWTPTSCVAQDLGVRLLSNQAEFVAESAGLDLPDGWRDLLYQLMLPDIDHENLYDPALDGFVDDPTFGPPRMVSMPLQDWFTPYPDADPLPPYLSPTPDRG